MGEHLSRYRQSLQDQERESQASYDKTVLSLSGGALGVSFAFVKDFIGTWAKAEGRYWLFAAWACWALSLASVLYSFLCSQQALRKTVERLDAGTLDLACRFDRLTGVLNTASGALFVAGVLAVGTFIWANTGG